jgi:DNA-binding HxlR family transcriptional regulator
MKKRAPAGRRSGCPISIGLEIFGDAWSLLVLRDLTFKGLCTYNEFLNAGEGVASNVLADRLKALEEHGIISKRPDPKDARRQIYRLTKKGVDLAPVLIELVLWAAKHLKTDAPPDQVRAMRFRREQVLDRIHKEWLAAGGD